MFVTFVVLFGTVTTLSFIVATCAVIVCCLLYDGPWNLALNCSILCYRSTNDPVIGKEINKHFSTPYFLSPQPSIENRIAWIFMGSPGPGAYMHVSV